MQIQSNHLPPEAIVEAFSHISASTIGHFTSEGYLAGIRPQLPNIKMVGCVRTAKVELPDASILRQALIEAQPGDVLVIECVGSIDYACWGELRNLAASIKKLAGVVISGKITDVKAIQSHSMPVFASGISAITTRAFPESNSGRLNETIHISGYEINPNYIAVGDDDGVFVLSPLQANRLLKQCQEKELLDETKRLALTHKLNNPLEI